MVIEVELDSMNWQVVFPLLNLLHAERRQEGQRHSYKHLKQV